ncbi:MAG TPA: serine/threonine-protein kinase [Kofleriaceae bacterium]|nr:serine/threonine-protein kinase [Kofleriaceae bacterium]
MRASPDQDTAILDETTQYRGEPLSLDAGDRVGRLTVLGTLASGGNGTVVLAHDPELDRRVALKVLLPEVSRLAGTGARDRLQREAMVMARLAHPNIVAVYDVGTWCEQAYVAMEYVEGLTLLDWVRAAPRTWRQILDVLLAAGRGLAAANASGIVHRDVKPANVLCGSDGRVRVTDFGIADLLSEARSAGQHSDIITGTPGYMSPEQMTGLPTDQRSDQFSFCVTAWEALCGQPPFRGDTLPALVHAVHTRAIARPPTALMPAAIRRVLLRGLAEDPADRYRSMDELLGALVSAARRPRRWIAGGALAAAVVVATTAGALAAGHAGAGQVCGGAEERLRGVWDAGRRAAVEQAFGAAGLADPAAAFARFAGAVDERASGWAAARAEACRATRVTGEQSEAVLDARMQCLDEQLRAIDALVDMAADAAAAGGAGAGALNGALEAAHMMPAADACSAAAVARRGRAATFDGDPAAAARAAELDRLLARARTAIAMAQLASAEEALAAAEAIAAELKDPVRRARLLMLRGRRAQTAGDLDGASATYTAAADEAARAGAGDLVAEAAARMAYLTGVERQQPDEAAPWFSAAELELARGSGDDELRAHLEEARGKIAFVAHDLAGARERAERALDLHERARGSEGPASLSALRLLAAARAGLGERDEAAALYRRALEIAEAAYGAEHPQVASTITMLARLEAERGDLKAARAGFERALAIRRRSLPADHPRLAESYGDLGIVAAELGDREAAEQHLRRWLAAEERADPDGLNLTPPLINLGSLLRDAGELDEARALLERAIALYERERGADYPGLVAPLIELADLHYGATGCQAAAPLLTRALRIAEKAPEGDPTASYALVPLSWCESEVGSPERALELARRAAAMREAFGMPPSLLAEARFAEARALWAGGRRADGRRLADQARGQASPELAREIDEWLAEAAQARERRRRR